MLITNFDRWYTMPKRWCFVAGVSTALMLCAGCGSATNEARSGAAASPKYLFERVADPESQFRALYPPTLANNLPNHTTVFVDGKHEVSTKITKALVIGTVVKVERGEAITYDDAALSNEEPVPTFVGWTDPNVDERNLLVTVEPSQSFGDVADSDPVTFRLNVIAGSDPDQFERAARALGKVVVLLKESRAERHRGEFIPARGPSGIGIIDESGHLSFPGMPERQERFMAGLDTVDELVEASSSSPAVDRIDRSMLTP